MNITAVAMAVLLAASAAAEIGEATASCSVSSEYCLLTLDADEVYVEDGRILFDGGTSAEMGFLDSSGASASVVFTFSGGQKDSAVTLSIGGDSLTGRFGSRGTCSITVGMESMDEGGTVSLAGYCDCADSTALGLTVTATVDGGHSCTWRNR